MPARVLSPRPGPVPRPGRAARACLAGALLVGSAAACSGEEVTAGPAASAVVSAETTPGAPTAVAPGPSSPASSSPGPSSPTPSSPAPSSPRTAPAEGGQRDGSSSPEPTGTTTTAAVSGPPAADEHALEEPDGAGTGLSEQEADGGPLSVVSVRSARHDGFDRVVLELAGEEGGDPGWYVRYVDEPTQEGSGAPLDVEGDAFLDISVRGVGYPFDTGQDELIGTVPGQGTDLVREVLVGGVFEGQAQVVVGLSEQVPYEVTRLQDPPRVVLDLVG